MANMQDWTADHGELYNNIFQKNMSSFCNHKKYYPKIISFKNIFLNKYFFK